MKLINPCEYLNEERLKQVLRYMDSIRTSGSETTLRLLYNELDYLKKAFDKVTPEERTIVSEILGDRNLRSGILSGEFVKEMYEFVGDVMILDTSGNVESREDYRRRMFENKMEEMNKERLEEQLGRLKSLTSLFTGTLGSISS